MVLEVKAMSPSALANNDPGCGVPAASDVFGTVKLLREGLPVGCFLSLSQAVGLKEKDLALLVGISPSTMARRKKAGAFTLQEGERVLRYIRVYEQAVELFGGDAPAARRWLTKPNKLLEDKTPYEFAATEAGARFVAEVIGRLEHGVFS
jgi:putative toxin-antitoxin system antitoxin component (TIGR02293 family)